MSWVYKTAVQQLEALRTGEISAQELLQETIQHTEELIPYINPVALKLYERAREFAQKADMKLARKQGGPLCGLPITVKDSQWLAGYRCANGSLSLKDFVPGETSQSIQRLERAGAVIFAKTTCPEFSLSGITDSELYGTTSNPWNIGHTPGGSSGGAGAAVAAGMGSLSLGGDGGGSIRIPASFCGITGFKPSFGNVPRAPGFSTWESIVSYGPMTRSVDDAQLMYDVLLGKKPEIRNQRDLSSPLKMVASVDLGFAPVDDAVRRVFNETVEKIQSAGHKVNSGHPGLSSSVSTWAITATHDMWKHKGQQAKENVGDYAKEFIKFGSMFSESDFADARIRREEIHLAYSEFFKRQQTDILITPAMGCEAFVHGRAFPEKIGNTEITYPWLDWAGFLYDANLMGCPACSIPMGTGDNGLPLGLQVLGLPGTDDHVLKVARELETIIGWKAPEFTKDHYMVGEPSLSDSEVNGVAAQSNTQQPALVQ